jgi:hypothetical protein
MNQETHRHTLRPLSGKRGLGRQSLYQYPRPLEKALAYAAEGTDILAGQRCSCEALRQQADGQ